MANRQSKEIDVPVVVLPVIEEKKRKFCKCYVLEVEKKLCFDIGCYTVFGGIFGLNFIMEIVLQTGRFPQGVLF